MDMYKVDYYTIDRNATGLLAHAKCYEDVWYTEMPLSILEHELSKKLDVSSNYKYKPVITKIEKIIGHF